MTQIAVDLMAEGSAITAATLTADKLGITLSKDGIAVNAGKGDRLEIKRENGVFTISYSILPEFLRGMAICTDAIRKNGGNADFSPVYQTRQFETCGVMFDVSRNAVLSVDAVKDFLEYMAVMGLNMMMLYTEDTYEIEGYPMFGFMRGRYSKEEIKEIDSYACKLEIELIPCIQTLAHLATTLRWSYARPFRSTEGCMYVGKEDTYAFIEDMFRTVRECFTTNRIHVGLDEAMDISTGRIMRDKGYIEPFELMIEHVNRVCEIAGKYGLEPMMWSDMFFKNGKLGGDYDPTSVIPENTSGRLPSNICQVYWDYTYTDPAFLNRIMDRHEKELKRELVFAGGIWTWNRMVTNYYKSFATARSQLKLCREHGVKTVFATVWNNVCAMYNTYSILPGIQMYAELFYSEEVSDEQLSVMFEICTGYRLEDFLLLGLDDFDEKTIADYADRGAKKFCANPSAQHFFNDILIGLYDKTLSGYDFQNYYQGYLSKLENLGDMGKFNLLFDQTTILAKILILKSAIGPDLAKVYSEGNLTELGRLCGKLKDLLALYREYHQASLRAWHSYNKPFGWEGCDTYLGGMEARVTTAISRVEGYLNGTYLRLEELEAERVYFDGTERPITETASFKKITSVCNY